MSEPAVILAEGISFRYGSLTALDSVSLTCMGGQIIALAGPNGGGKSTLFKLLATLLRPQEGRISILGHQLPEQASTARRAMGIVFQSPALDGKLTARENLRFAGNCFGLSGAPLEDRITRCAEATQVADRLNDKVETLSGGLRRRVEIARALLPQPRVLLLDEPSTGLDPLARAACWEIYRTLRQQGLCILLTTHFLDEASEADTVALLHKGRIVAQGPPAQLCQALGGKILAVRSSSPAQTAEWLRAQPGVRDATALMGEARAQADDPAALAKALLDSPHLGVTSTTISLPTLADVFARHTGLTFAEAENSATPALPPHSRSTRHA